MENIKLILNRFEPISDDSFNELSKLLKIKFENHLRYTFHITLAYILRELTKEEIKNCEDLGNYYRINADNRDLNYNKYYTIGNSNNKINEYNSNNTDQLNLEDTIKLLVDLQEVKKALN